MTRNDFLDEVLDACSFYWWEIHGVYCHYEIVSVTSHFVQISKIHWGFDSGYAEVVDLENNEDLIDKMIEVL